MPRPKSSVPMTEHKIRLFQGDFDRLNVLFPALGSGPAVRKLVRNFLNQIESANKPLELDLSVDVEELLND